MSSLAEHYKADLGALESSSRCEIWRYEDALGDSATVSVREDRTVGILFEWPSKAEVLITLGPQDRASQESIRRSLQEADSLGAETAEGTVRGLIASGAVMQVIYTQWGA